MIKKILIGLVALIVIGAVVFFILAAMSRGGSAPGLVEGKLAPCPGKPNCVSSEAGTPDSKKVDPIAGGDETWASLKSAIEAEGGEITSEEGSYLSAEFKSKLYGFVDDVELRMDDTAGVIHIRSGSRVGYSDRGVNKARVAAIRARVQP